jgi:HSP20 family protein
MRRSSLNTNLFPEAWGPAVDVIEGKDSIKVKADLPGFTKDQITVSVKDDLLMIQGERKEEKESEENGYSRVERAFGSFSRVVELPSEVDINKVKATYQNGVLELVLPKKEGEKSTQIKIE